MLSGLKLENFRAFKSEEFSFTKLNIFVGPNNSGKSSALSAVNVLAQTLAGGVINSSPLILNGEYDQLGTFKDAVHGGRANTPMKISFNYSQYELALEVKYRLQRREMELTRFSLQRGKGTKIEYQSSKDKYDVIIGSRKIEDLIGLSAKRKPRFYGFLPLFRFRNERFVEEDEATSEHTENLSIVRGAEREMFRLRSSMLRDFQNYESISPFRHQPQRTYLTSGETPSAVGRNGQNAITMLASDASRRGAEKIGIVEAVGNWLRASHIASDLKVKHLTDRHFEIVVVDMDGSEHNICDVGFGVSQALPVLVAGVRHVLERTFGSSILTVQEPEIHLHPNAQAEMGTFLATVSKARGQVFIETHSDALLLRIARHVAQGELSQDDVAIFFVENTANGRKVSRVEIDNTGGFTPDWPGNFFPQRQMESRALARIAFGGKQSGDQLSLFEFGN